MIVTIVRHGQAGNAATDEMRELTGKGVDDVSFASHRLAALCHERSLATPERILHSTWRRTSQTAQILSAGLAIPMAHFDALLPQSCVGDVDRGFASMVASSEPTQHYMLVGHQPLVSELVDHYLGDPGLAPSLPPGGLVTINFDVVAASCGSLLFWALPPEYHGGV